MATRRFDRPTQETFKNQTAFARFHEKFLSSLETGLDNIQSEIGALAAAQAAQATANTAHNNDKLTSSSIIPANVMTASDAGTDASVIIANHTRLYGDASQIAVTGATLTGLAYSTTYGVYYDDPTFTNATPTYHATTTASNALNNFVAGRHFLGTVTTPASGGAATTGGSSPPGTGGVDRGVYSSL